MNTEKNLLNVEIKAYCSNQEFVRSVLKNHNATYKGIDHQIDTYFNTIQGRLKLREGNIENKLIQYYREDKSGPKESKILLHQSNPDSSLKEILIKSLGILTIVDKKREIYFIDNVKFHVDNVKDLGKFVEIEAIDEDGTIGRDKLLAQCEYYVSAFKILQENLISESYSDLIIANVEQINPKDKK